jgi:hypothetical protein
MKLKEKASCEKVARTGRVQNWLDNPESRLPCSCTVFVVEDKMEGANGIEQSWRFVSHGLRNGAGVAVHLSNLRAKGSENGKGLVASGPVSFGKIYSTLNEILRRGGVYKNGAVVLHLDYNHPDAIEFINAPRKELPWVKRCINVDENFLEESSEELIEALLLGISSGDIWLNKIRYDDKGNRIRGNVCLEVYLPSRGTCLLQHVNLGACDLDEVEGAFVEAMTQLCELHSKTGIDKSGEYLSPDIDKQVGLGVLGLANFLSIQGVTYKEFGQALDTYLHGSDDEWSTMMYHTKAGKLVYVLENAIEAAAKIAREWQMDRAFAIAPTASCSYRYLDNRGYTTAPEIAPPISRVVDRDSGTFGVESFDYGPVETAAEVGWEDYYKVANGIVELFQQTKLFHGYSFNSWSDVVVYDHEFLKNWLESPQTSLYYSLQVLPDTQRKDDAYAALDTDFKSMFGLDNDETGGFVTTNFEEPEVCSMDAGFCSSCAE